MKASKMQILPPKEQQAANHRLSKLEVTEAGSLIMEDQIQIEEENQVCDRLTDHELLQLPLSSHQFISGIYDKDRARIASKKEEASKHLQKKKARGASGQVECVKHKKQKNQHTKGDDAQA